MGRLSLAMGEISGMVDFGNFTHVTFDCYGTLIDWETGILTY